jgi:hypothetical protein
MVSNASVAMGVADSVGVLEIVHKSVGQSVLPKALSSKDEKLVPN